MQASVPNPRRLTWTLGNILMVAGLYLLVYVGGMYADDAYNRAAARGDNALPLPAAAAAEPAAPQSPDAFVVPDLSGAAPAVSAAAAAPGPHRSTVTRLVIPRIDVDSKVVEVGWTLEDGVAIWQVAKYAVGQHKGSANPGEGSNIVMAGHVGGSAPVFGRLVETQPGDQILVYSGGAQYLYVVREVERVQEVGVSDEQRLANAAYMDPTSEEMVTLITCWPPTGPNAFDQRIVVRAVPYASQQLPGAGANWSAR